MQSSLDVVKSRLYCAHIYVAALSAGKGGKSVLHNSLPLTTTHYRILFQKMTELLRGRVAWMISESVLVSVPIQSASLTLLLGTLTTGTLKVRIRRLPLFVMGWVRSGQGR